ncbi:type II toxin-antitoxin system Phd/YefM family antitoxin [Herbiconiux moechotypicola]|uniref:Antitoxin n=1 Tax=Herbiconiux moechotypicola TaxID=637393 RepID=A0ABP5Q630_9MICO|nr:type II toxin-antitoxin system Phd/YefM family antitoxin [Herbiconiux moechotypicola]MCS5728785.1 type II toxin-antitoxin system Phd/YefM family antitoxin [Herbiconiux moechotypicola]
MSISNSVPLVWPSSEVREQLPAVLRRFRVEKELAAPVIFGSHRKPEAVVIPFELYARLLPAIEDLEIAEIVRARSAAGPVTPLSEVAASIGLDPADYE